MSETLRVHTAVIGAGVTGLATAAWLEADHSCSDVVVLEAGDRPGGKIRSEEIDGHLLEWGPQGFLDTQPDTLDLAEYAGLTTDLVQAADRSAARFIVRGGRLREVPTSPPAFLTSGLLPLTAMLRLLAEPFSRRRPDGDESVFDFAARRIGRTAAEVLVDAMVTGVFAGDSRQLSLAATFPKMAAMEAEHGSLTRALFAKRRAARRAGASSSGPAGPGGTLTTFTDGMEALPRALAASLGDRLRLGRPVQSLERSGGRLRLVTPHGAVEAEHVALCAPAATAARLLEPLAPTAVPDLKSTPTVPVSVVMTSYPDGAFGRPLDGFGFLVPRGEDLGILGTLFCHAIFPGQAPPGSVFLRTMIGGAREPAAAHEDDDDLMSRVRTAHRRVLGSDPEPTRQWIVRWAEGISQYTLGHLDRVQRAEEAARAVGVELAGSPYRGVSVNDCVHQAREVARRVA